MDKYLSNEPELRYTFELVSVREQPTTELAGMPVNDDISLEIEADRMNHKAKRQEQVRRLSRYWQELNKLEQKKEKDSEYLALFLHPKNSQIGR